MMTSVLFLIRFLMISFTESEKSNRDGDRDDVDEDSQFFDRATKVMAKMERKECQRQNSKEGPQKKMGQSNKFQIPGSKVPLQAITVSS